MLDKEKTPHNLLLVAIMLVVFFISPFGGVHVQGTTRQQHQPITILGNTDFTQANGVAPGGDGSLLNPFVISGWNFANVNGIAINIRYTTANFAIRNVFISSSTYGIMLYNVTNGEVSNSTLYQNNNGIFLTFTNDSDVFNNNFVGNTIQANDTGAFPDYNYWDNGYLGGGNYWSDYAGVDHCSGRFQNQCPAPDGIGDTPYEILGSSGSADYYPLMKPYYPDTTPPFWPSGSELTVHHVTFTSLTLNWTLATDDTGVIGYRIFEGQALIGNVTANKSSFSVTGLKPATSYNFTVQAGDRADNWSDGLSRSVTTPSQQPWYFTAAFWVGNWYLFITPIAAVISALTIRRILRKRRSQPNPTVDSSKN